MSKVSPHFKPTSSALLLIDYQVGTMQLIRNQMPETSLRNAIALAKAALAFNMPIVLTSSQEDHLQGPVAELSPACAARAVCGSSPTDRRRQRLGRSTLQEGG